MRLNRILGYLIPFVLVFVLFSCSEDNDWENEEHTLTIKVYSNTVGVPIRVVGIGGGDYLVIKDYFESTHKTTKDFVQVEANCDDPNTLITIEIFINRKLKSKQSGNREVGAGCKIK